MHIDRDRNSKLDDTDERTRASVGGSMLICGNVMPIKQETLYDTRNEFELQIHSSDPADKVRQAQEQ